MGDFRKLGTDRNSVAVNAATATPPYATNPVVGDITKGSVVLVKLDGTGAANVPVGVRKTGAVLLGTGEAGNIDTFAWTIVNGALDVTVTGTSVASVTLPFWLF